MPAISTAGVGEFTASIDKTSTTITYSLTFGPLSADATQAHIHFGQRGVSGGVVAFLCTNLGNAPVATQACPAQGGTITGTITAADIIAGAASQGIAANEFAEVVSAMRAGRVYANVHSTSFPAGEIRAQLGKERN